MENYLNNFTCPLCFANRVVLFHEDKRRPYFRCGVCQLIFVPADFHLEPADEKAEYDLHQNSSADPGYRKFLSRLFEPVQAQVAPGSHGLDFGSGPGPTLSVMFEEAGHQMTLYDPFYATDSAPLARQYDFVTASEVVEHFHHPGEDLRRLWACVQTGGLLGIMTKLAFDQKAFARWHYKNDRTHVSFFSRQTFSWLATEWNAELTFVGNDVILLRKS